MGDADKTVEEELIKTYNLNNIDILKVGHHGSSGSSSEEFLKWAVPQYAFISCGKNNSYGHPHAETLERLETTGSKIFSTAECGAISIEPALEIEVKSWCSSN